MFMSKAITTMYLSTIMTSVLLSSPLDHLRSEQAQRDHTGLPSADQHYQLGCSPLNQLHKTGLPADQWNIAQHR